MVKIWALLLAIVIWGPIQGWSQDSITNSLLDFAKKSNISEDRDFYRFFQSGLHHFEQGNYEQAAEEFGRAALKSPNHPAPNFYLAITLFTLEQYPLSGRILRRVSNIYPNLHNLPLNFITFFPSQFNFYRAREKFEKWLFSAHRSNENLFLFGFLCHFSHAPQKAQKIYKLIISKDPTFVEAQKFLNILTKENISSFPKLEVLTNKAQQAFYQSNFGAASGIWASIFIYYPNHPEVLYPLAHSLCASGQLNHSVEILRKAVVLAPTTSLPSLRDQFRPVQIFDQMLRDLEQQLQQNPSNFSLLLLLSYFYLSVGEQEKVKIALKHLEKRFPNDPLVLFLLQKSKNFPRTKVKEAVKKTVKPLKRKPASFKEDIFQSRGKKAFKQEEYEKAAKFFTQSFAKNPQNLKAQELMCLGTFAIAQYSYTYSILKRVLELSPRKEESLDWIPYYKHSSIFEKQLKSLSSWIQNHPEDDKALFVLGVVMVNSGKKKSAKGVFSRLQQRFPNDPDIVYFSKMLGLK